MADNVTVPTPSGERLFGAQWVREAFPRVGVPYADLRDGGIRKPEETPRKEVERIIEQFSSAFEKGRDPETGNRVYRLRRLWTVVPGVTGLAVMSGGLASFSEWAKATLIDARKRLSTLEPLGCNPCFELINPITENINISLDTLMMEFSQEPRQAQVDTLFGTLLDHENDENENGLLYQLEQQGGYSDTVRYTNVLTAQDEEHFTNFRILRESLESLSASWGDFKPGLDTLLGVETVHISWKCQAIREITNKIGTRLDKACMSGAVTWTSRIVDGEEPMSLGAFRQLLSEEPQRWNRMIRETGRQGLRTVRPFVENLIRLLDNAKKSGLLSKRLSKGDTDRAPEDKIEPQFDVLGDQLDELNNEINGLLGVPVQGVQSEKPKSRNKLAGAGFSRWRKRSPAGQTGVPAQDQAPMKE